MEILLKHSNPSLEQVKKEESFLVGLLSLLDALFMVPMEDILNELNMGQEIQDAILYKKGFLGKLLNLVIKTEENAVEELEPLLQDLDLTFGDLSKGLIEGFSWTNSMGADNE